MSTFALRVYGAPQPQGSTTAYIANGRAHVTAAGTPASRKRKATWRTDIVHAVRRDLDAGTERFADTEPLSVAIVFWMPRPATHLGTGRNAGTVRKGAPHWPGVKPDLDKLVRAVLDACTAAGLWRDDAQVIALAALKRYATADEPAGMDLDVETAPAYVERPQLVLA
jgi:Holliday junction resolvase RusA-like endonuclease